MQIISLNSVDSTQKYLKELIKQNSVQLPYAVTSNIQTAGMGSRDNTWESLDGNLFLSFAIELKNLPKDLKLESASIYFAYILKITLSELNSSLWLKWPNDFFIDDKKIGGMITNIFNDTLICGVGLNIKNVYKDFDKLDIKINKNKLIELYFQNIKKKYSWKQIFSNYELEFYRSKFFFTHNENLRISLEDASLQKDGSIIINGKRIYSLR
ncbi:MAG: biotin--[acetyl-CoA-carboxylase] ligase [Sulfurimonas sp.]|nr:biotin--[acetyl-CoA-carboxylase] ligase [Sulfurimonas sp.]